MTSRMILLWVVVGLWGFAQTADAQEIGEPARAIYVVQPGDTLIGIAIRELGSAREVYSIIDLNPDIEDPNQIQTSQVIRLPEPPSASETSTAELETATPTGIERGFVWVYETWEGWGVAGIGVALLLSLYLGAQLAVYVLFGGVFLWLGALIGNVDAGFGKSILANLKGTILSVVGALLLWGAVGAAFAFVSPQTVQELSFEKLLLTVFGVAAGIGLIQFVIYTDSVRKSFEIGFFRSVFVCLAAILLQGLLAVAATPVLCGAALGI